MEKPATCMPGTATKDGQELATYDYRVSKSMWVHSSTMRSSTSMPEAAFRSITSCKGVQ